MFGVLHQVRQALLAALVLSAPETLAETIARYDQGVVVVSGLASGTRAEVLADPGLVRLQVAGLASTRGMPVYTSVNGRKLIVRPEFELRQGTDYVLRLGDAEPLKISVPHAEAPTPKLIRFEPSQAVIPANTLRVYLHFSEPMARGQIRQMVTLVRKNGSRMDNPFLALGPELWDSSQTRVTLLLDPGRIKQGVGPNIHAGAPLAPGQSYQLLVDERLNSAAGVPLGRAASVAFRVGPAERRAIAPETWQVLAPTAGSRTPLTVVFDRIMDIGAARRLITLRGPDGDILQGQIETDGGGWSIFPRATWLPGSYVLTVDPDLEDISGNTPIAAFDAAARTMGSVQEVIDITLEIKE